MLSNDTRKIIDEARDTLVGQIPVPMMQCQQITLALTYKFMSDDDEQAVDLGGQPHYFTDDLEKYTWNKIVSRRIDDTQRSELYREGITALRDSKTMPAVFQEIFKDAVVPYGDHRTLALFLNTMNRMEYDNSEKLGDAYEYLLKTAEAQADAGQFRTPRHIIDFIVNIVNPQKHEIIIDPACGTAGFLVSTYQHVKSQHELPGGGTTLSTPDLTRLADNLKGYDISPEMTKLAMANMYLHTQNKNPNIDNYDTLTSTDHWNEYADVMLANPPFMTPKGGIKPHARFRVPAKRAEVLFVDYIASHLNEHGRAGIIVPEGIIFQSQNAYKQLRRLLLDESLVAVISLPGGVFNPYSGVKTSILILDKVLAPKADSIAFFKVEKDGYDLGAQRRPIGKDDLPAVTDEIGEYLRRLKSGESLDDFAPQTGLVVAKDQVAADNEYNLSGERYRENGIRDTTLQWYPIGTLIQTVTPPAKIPKAQFGLTGLYPIIDQSQEQISGWTNDATKVVYPQQPLVIFGDHTCAVKLVDYPFAQGADGIKILKTNEDLDPRYLYCTLLARPLDNDGYKRHFSLLKRHEIPLPPLEVQRELVAEIEGYQRVLDGARAVVENWRPRIRVDQDWPIVELGELTKPEYGYTASASDEGEARFVRITDITGDGTLRPDEAMFLPLDDDSRKYLLSKGDVLVARTGATYGKTMLFGEDYPSVFASYLIRLRFPGDTIIPAYYWAFAQTESYWHQAQSLATGGGQPQFNGNALKRVKVPLPPVEAQRQIVLEIEAEQNLVSANRELVGRMEQRIQDAIARVWEG